MKSAAPAMRIPSPHPDDSRAPGGVESFGINPYAGWEYVSEWDSRLCEDGDALFMPRSRISTQIVRLQPDDGPKRDGTVPRRATPDAIR
jgi:hypothetical protein